MIPAGGAVAVILSIIVYGFCFWLLYWLVGALKIPEPFVTIAYAVLAIASVAILISLLLSLIGGPSFVPAIRL